MSNMQNKKSGEREDMIMGTTIMVIHELISQIEGYMREYIGTEEDEALEYIRTKEWYYENEFPSFPTCRDWFMTMTLNGVKEYLKPDQIELNEDEIDRVKNLIHKTLDEFRFKQGSGCYCSYRIGFRKFES